MVQLQLRSLMLLVVFPIEISSFLHPHDVLGRGTKWSSRISESDKKQPTETPDALTKVPWYAVEAFGRVFGSNKNGGAAPPTLGLSPDVFDELPSSVRETQDRIKMDNDREYFLSGTIDELIYSKDCTFADPFVSFQGRDRFVANLANLGSFITKYSARPLTYSFDETTNSVTTKFMVKLELNLPWKPVLAWPWGVRCDIDPQTFLIVLHEESWDIEAWEGVRQIFRKPTTSV